MQGRSRASRLGFLAQEFKSAALAVVDCSGAGRRFGLVITTQDALYEAVGQPTDGGEAGEHEDAGDQGGSCRHEGEDEGDGSSQSGHDLNSLKAHETLTPSTTAGCAAAITIRSRVAVGTAALERALIGRPRMDAVQEGL